MIRSKHNDLLNYFVHDKRDLSPAYVKSCEKFLKEISHKLQAPSATKQTQLNDIRFYVKERSKKDNRGPVRTI